MIRKGLVVLPLILANMKRRLVRGPSQGGIQAQVVPFYPTKVVGTMAELLIRSDNLDLMVKQINGFLCVHAVLTHFTKSLNKNCALLYVCWSHQHRRSEHGRDPHRRICVWCFRVFPFKRYCTNEFRR